MHAEYRPLPRRSGRIAYRYGSDHALWGEEDFTITRDAAGCRTLVARCEMNHEGDAVVRDCTLTVDAAFQPVDCYVRIVRQGTWTGSGWFWLGGEEAEAECVTVAAGRASQRAPIERPMRGFGVHALVADAWVAAPFPFDRGPGTVHHFATNLNHSLHHLGATGPALEASGMGLCFEGVEEVMVPAGRFECYRFSMLGLSGGHPPYTMWFTTDGDFVYVRGVATGHFDWVFELETLHGEPLGAA